MNESTNSTVLQTEKGMAECEFILLRSTCLQQNERNYYIKFCIFDTDTVQPIHILKFKTAF